MSNDSHSKKEDWTLSSFLCEKKEIQEVSVIHYLCYIFEFERGLVMNGPRPVIAKQSNTILWGYVWDPNK